MVDYSLWNEYEGASEGSGRSEKIWLTDPQTNQTGLFKYKKDENTTDHISECIAYNLASLLGIECARFELGIYNGREGSMSYNMINEKQILIEGLAYIIQKYPNYDKELLKDEKNTYSLEMIREAIEPVPELNFKDFLVIPLFDYLIGNTDRHQNNWATILENGKVYFSPLYDNSSSLCAYMTEKEMQACLGKDAMKWKSVVETKSRSIIRIFSEDVNRPTHLEVLKYLRDNYYEETEDMVQKMIFCINEKSIDNILQQYSDEQLPMLKKQVIKKFLLSKIIKMQEVYFEEESPYVERK